VTADLAYRSATDLLAALRRREVSSAELVAHGIARIEALDGRINAVVVRDFARARQAADAADAALARGERRPLLGLPMTVKESFNVAGLPTTWGYPQARGFLPAEDALAVARLKAAGAIILGKTNVPHDLGDWQSYNDIYGTTNNPWDTGRSPGGSSGGAAAALAAGFVALELGSDIGGSLRTPAHFCGVCAHKPTHAVLPSRGQTPPGVSPLPVEPELAVIGPMARSAADLALAFDVLAGPDPLLGTACRLDLPPPRHAALKDYRVLVLGAHPLIATSASVRDPIMRLAARLEAAGAKVAHGSPLLPDLALQARIYMRRLMGFFGGLAPQADYDYVAALVRALPESDNSLAAWRGRGLVASHRDWMQAGFVSAGQQQQWRALFAAFDVVLAPPMPTPAFPHDHSADQEQRRIDVDGVALPYPDQLAWPGVATLPLLPATAIPLERTESGLPTGVQIIGPYLEDRTPLAFAGLIEREFGGFVPPPGW
jgi:amidase